MSNLNGYSDYAGPSNVLLHSSPLLASQLRLHDDDENENEDDHDPLQVGFWMPGDSLAPPCGMELSLIPKLLEFAQVQSNDILYDLGCGDGRICWEAWATRNCQALGIELEHDLIQKFHNISQAMMRITNTTTSEENNTENPTISQNNNRQQQQQRQQQRMPRIIQKDLRDVLKQWVVEQKTDTRSTSAVPNMDDDVNVDMDDDDDDDDWPFPTLVILYLLPESLQLLLPDLLVLLQQQRQATNNNSSSSLFRIVCIGWGLSTIPASRHLSVVCSNDDSGGIITTTSFYWYDPTCLVVQPDT